MMQHPIIQQPVKYAGAYWVNGFAIQVERRPMWIHRQLMRWFFGWVWRDAVDSA